MADMPIQCVVCGTNKNPSLMYSSDTCHECAEVQVNFFGSARAGAIRNISTNTETNLVITEYPCG